MLIVLTDVLTCPRCGPEFGLVILADRLEERRVLDGSLGCANCRELFPVAGGLPDLRFPPAPLPPPPPASPPADEEEALRLAALMGVTEGPGIVVVVGDRVRAAAGVAALVPDVGVVAAGPAAAHLPDAPGTSRILCDARIPLRDRAARGVALTGEAASSLLEEGLRILVPGGRIVLQPAPADAEARLRAAEYEPLLAQDDLMVASYRARR